MDFVEKGTGKNIPGLSDQGMARPGRTKDGKNRFLKMGACRLHRGLRSAKTQYQ